MKWSKPLGSGIKNISKESPDLYEMVWTVYGNEIRQPSVDMFPSMVRTFMKWSGLLGCYKTEISRDGSNLLEVVQTFMNRSV